MLRVRLLGAAVVEGENGPLGGAAGQRKSLAVLGLLGAAGDRGMSRDRILAYVWPEVGLEKGSHRLTQVLYALRRELDTDDLCLGSCELRLNPERVWTDLREFETARLAGDLERAVQLYGGPFLDGFFLTDAPEFERWVENERAGYAQQVVEALETLAAKSAAAGDHRRSRDAQVIEQRPQLVQAAVDIADDERPRCRGRARAHHSPGQATGRRISPR